VIRATLCTFALALAAQGAEKAAAWDFGVRASGQRVAHTKVRGTGPGGACDATLVFSRSADAARKPVTKDNVTTPPLVVELWLTNAKQTAPFNLDDFEGPDAPSGSAKLVTSSVSGKGKPWARKWTASGWFSPLGGPTGISAEHRRANASEVFVFGIGNVLKDYHDLLQLADALAQGADSLTIEIAAKSNGSPPLRFDVPLAGASEAIQQLMAAGR
jgi:hypothetical protein